MIISQPEELLTLTKNTFMGELPSMQNSRIHFADGARSNILFFEGGVKLVNSDIYFHGSNSVCFLRRNRHNYLVNLSLHNNGVLHFGRDTYINGCVHIISSEEKHFFIGDNGLISFGVWCRTADPHLIYDGETKQRLNYSKSIFIGDHVWIGQSALILKGAEVDSGSIIGGMCVLPGKKVDHNSSWAGNPGRLIKSGVFWDGSCVNHYTQEQTERSSNWDGYISAFKQLTTDSYVYEFCRDESISFSRLDTFFSTHTPQENVDFLKNLDTSKNRFVHEIPKLEKANNAPHWTKRLSAVLSKNKEL